LNIDIFLDLAWEVSQLLHRPWWSRVWILQEVALSKRATVYCGSRALDWKHISELVVAIEKSHLIGLLHRRDSIRDFRKTSVVLNMLQDSILHGYALVAARQEHLYRNPLDLYRLLSMADNFDATDPRDKVFALLGLTNPSSQLKADYGQSIAKVYTSAALNILEEHGDLRSFEWFDGHDDKSSDLPSWVPDFRLDSGYQTAPISTTPPLRNNSSRWYSASGSKHPGLGHNLRVTNGGQVLVLRGITFDAIKELGEAAPRKNSFLINGESESLARVLPN
jgi:hypothetical protein